MDNLTIFALIGGVGIALGVFGTRFWRYVREKRLLGESLSYALLRVSLPKSETQSYEKAKEEIGAFEQFLAMLQNFRHPIVMEMAVPHVGEEIHFYLAASRKEVDALERAVHAFWPIASVERTTDYNIFNPDGVNSVSVGYLRERYVLPLRRYRTMDADPLVALTNALSKLAYEGEGAAIQYIFFRAPAWTSKVIRYVIEQLRRGTPKALAIQSGTFVGSLKLFMATFSGRSVVTTSHTGVGTSEMTRSLVVDEDLVKLLGEKEAKPMLAVNIRLVVSAQTKERADAILDAIEHSYDQFIDPRANSIRFLRLNGGAAQREIFDFSFRNFRFARSMFLTTEECASLVHFPTSAVETPKLEIVRARVALAPLNLPSEGLILGKNVFRGEERLVRILRDDRRRHVYIIGQTGTGKTVLLQEMARQDIEAGEGVCVIDPHGDLAENILGLVPPSRVKDVVYFNPTDIDRPIGLNILEYDPQHPEQKTFVINEMVEIMDKLWDLRQVGGPMFEQYLRNAMLLVMGDSEIKATIMEIPKVLADAEFRTELLSRCTNPSVVNFWTKEAERAGGEFALANIVPYITSKLNPFIANDIVRPIVGQVTTRFNVRELMDNQKILIVNLAKGVLGETNSYLLGMIIVGKILMAALSRVDRPENERKDFYLYIDEFQNVTTRTVASILAEARKYRLNLIIAHQFTAQLKDEIRDAIFGNVGTMVTFRVGAPDAELLEKQYLPTFNKQDLINLDNYNAYVKLLISGQVTSPFNIVTFPPTRGTTAVRDTVKDWSRQNYGSSRADVELEIARRITR